MHGITQQLLRPSDSRFISASLHNVHHVPVRSLRLKSFSLAFLLSTEYQEVPLKTLTQHSLFHRRCIYTTLL